MPGHSRQMASLQILFTGDYLPDYNRTQIIRAGLKKLGHTVIDFPFKKKNKANRAQLIKLSAKADLVFLPSFTHQQVAFVRKHAQGKKIVFDPLISRYLTKVHDYKLVSPYSLSALRNYFRDKLSLQAADFVVTDTMAHLEYFHEKFKIPKDKMGVLYIGNNFEEFHPTQTPKTNTVFHVGFYGGFIPLQGTLTILQAALILKPFNDIKFELIGSGFEFEKAKDFVHQNSLTNVSLPGWVPVTELCERINKFDIALGIFGQTQKSELVIPNKIYHYGSCAKAILTRESPAISELFHNQVDLMTIAPNAKEIADNILRLKNDPDLRQKLGRNIHSKLSTQYNEVEVARKLLSYVQ